MRPCHRPPLWPEWAEPPPPARRGANVIVTPRRRRGPRRTGTGTRRARPPPAGRRGEDRDAAGPGPRGAGEVEFVVAGPRRGRRPAAARHGDDAAVGAARQRILDRTGPIHHPSRAARCRGRRREHLPVAALPFGYRVARGRGGRRAPPEAAPVDCCERRRRQPSGPAMRSSVETMAWPRIRQRPSPGWRRRSPDDLRDHRGRPRVSVGERRSVGWRVTSMARTSSGPGPALEDRRPRPWR